MDSDLEDGTKEEFRSKLSNMSFEELQKLKEKLGSKVYNETVYGTNSKKSTKPTTFKRENKNRPREISSKRTVPLVSKTSIKDVDASPRDPRFDSKCGTFNAKGFKRSYDFVTSIREKELQTLKKELMTTTNSERKEKLKYLIQRFENQEREEKKNQEKALKKEIEYNERKQLLKDGKKPIFMKKSEKKMMDLVEQYETLKSSGKLEKHITKHRKRNSQKSKKKISFM